MACDWPLLLEEMTIQPITSSPSAYSCTQLLRRFRNIDMVAHLHTRGSPLQRLGRAKQLISLRVSLYDVLPYNRRVLSTRVLCALLAPNLHLHQISVTSQIPLLHNQPTFLIVDTPLSSLLSPRNFVLSHASSGHSVTLCYLPPHAPVRHLLRPFPSSFQPSLLSRHLRPLFNCDSTGASRVSVIVHLPLRFANARLRPSIFRH